MMEITLTCMWRCPLRSIERCLYRRIKDSRAGHSLENECPASAGAEQDFWPAGLVSKQMRRAEVRRIICQRCVRHLYGPRSYISYIAEYDAGSVGLATARSEVQL